MVAQNEHPLRTWRISQRFKLRQVAADAGISIPLLSDIENWKRMPSARTARKLADCTKLPLEEILCERPR
jgi:transcriptional regulator with XRE-family HTH domain